MVAEIAAPVAWSPVRRYCTAGCMLTLKDFAP